MRPDEGASYCDRTTAEGSFYSVAEETHIYLKPWTMTDQMLNKEKKWFFLKYMQIIFSRIFF